MTETMVSHSPPVSVVMPVRNALPYLDEAIRSIVEQTWRDFEFVILDDASDDGSSERLRFWAARDARIRLFAGSRSSGPVGSANFVVAEARAPIVARMDADDIAAPDRLRRQLDLLGRHPDAVLVGSVWEGIDRQGRVVRRANLSSLAGIGFAAPFAHGSIMFRRTAFDEAGGYRAACAYWEDLDLYLRMADQGRVLVVPEPLYRHRFSETSTRLTSDRRRVEEAVDLMFRCRERFARHGEYESLLTPRGQSRGARKLHPFSFVSLGFGALWSGRRPSILKRLVRHGALRADSTTAKALVWALWAAMSPISLRATMRALLAYRNRRISPALSGLEACLWQPIPAPDRAQAAASGTARALSLPNAGELRPLPASADPALASPA